MSKNFQDQFLNLSINKYMCAIAGFIDKNNILNEDHKRSIADQMIATLSHRGNDGSGVFIRDSIVMTHNRLAIIDLSDKSSQPIFDNDYALSYNGEIYNYKELAISNNHSDTQFLFHYLKDDKDINLLDGMFAYSFVDTKNKIIKLQVDRFGIKPLYYFEDENFFIWSSEIKAIKLLPGVKFEFNDDILSEYLMYRSISNNQSLVKNLNKVLPGESVTYSIIDGNILRCKAVNNNTEDGKLISDEKQIYEIIENNIKKCLASDVPVGIQLSGGIDSSLIALVSNNFINNMHTYSIGMQDAKWNEFIYSRFISEKIKSNHHEIIFTKEEFIKNFKHVTYLLDEPVVHPNTIPMYLLSLEARKSVKVLMTGEGADEILGGYRRYNTLENKEKFNMISSEESVFRILKNPKMNMRSTIFESIQIDNTLRKYSKYDIETFLPNVLLRQDKASMGANIESRVPFLSNQISELLFNLDDSIKVGKYGSKNILKEILKRKFDIPADFIIREKCGFGLPVSEWIKDEDVFLTLSKSLDNHPLIIKYFKSEEVDKIVNQHISSQEDNSNILFTLLSLVTWYDIFIIDKYNGSTLS